MRADRVQEFSYRPAPVGKTVRIRVAPDRIVADTLWALDFADLDQAAFVRTRLGDSEMVRLDLYTSAGCHSVSFNGSRAGMETDEHARQHRAALIAILLALSRARPDMQVALGAVGGGRWGMFAVGGAAVLSGVGLVAAAVATGVSGDRLFALAMPVVLLLTVGGFLIAGPAPWRARPSVDPAVVVVLLAETAEGSPAQRSASDEPPR